MVGLGAKVILANNLALFVDNILNQELKEFANNKHILYGGFYVR